MSRGDKLLKEEVTAEEVAEVVSRWTGIPSTGCWREKKKSCSAWMKFCMNGL